MDIVFESRLIVSSASPVLLLGGTSLREQKYHTTSDSTLRRCQETRRFEFRRSEIGFEHDQGQHSRQRTIDPAHLHGQGGPDCCEEGRLERLGTPVSII